VFGSRKKNKEERKIWISMNEFKLKLDQIHSLKSVCFSLLNYILLNRVEVCLVRRICKHGITIKIPNRKWLVENGLKSSGR
jgi:hypothetical protein